MSDIGMNDDGFLPRLSAEEIARLGITGFEREQEWIEAAPDNAQTYEPPPVQPTVLKMTPEQAAELAELFPAVPVPYRPTGRYVTIQDRLPRTKTKGGLILSDVSKDEDMLRMNIGRVAAIGPRAFTDPITGEAMPPEFAVGDYVRVPRYTKDRPIEANVVWRNILPENISAVIVDVTAILR